MKILGYLLIITGFVMLIAKGINYTREKKVVDAGPLEINIKEKKTLTWPYYAGAIAIVAGIALVLMDRRKA